MHPNQFLSCHFREVGGLIPIPQQIVIDVMEFRYVAALIDSLEGYLLGAWLISCHIECSACKICRIQRHDAAVRMTAIMNTSSTDVKSWCCSGSSCSIRILAGMMIIDEINVRCVALADLAQAFFGLRTVIFFKCPTSISPHCLDININNRQLRPPPRVNRLLESTSLSYFQHNS
eukprot:scaffold4018_cov139-Skeletonema_marinoi.AAC.1